jgi:hypothetical protein
MWTGWPNHLWRFAAVPRMLDRREPDYKGGNPRPEGNNMNIIVAI